MNDTKGVVHVLTHVDVLRSGDQRWRYRTVTRVIREIEQHYDADFPEFRYDPPQWANDADWMLYTGFADAFGEEIRVYSWTWGDHPPLFWVGSMTYRLIGYEIDLAAWLWVNHSVDTPRWSYCGKYVWKYLGYDYEEENCDER